jgi:hypothetical protein
MPFLQAGFNGRHFTTGIRGWTRHIDGKSKFAPAELIRFEAGDYAWHGKRFLSWGECVVLGSWAISLAWEYQNQLPQCDLVTREELVPWQWVVERRAKIESGEVTDA